MTVDATTVRPVSESDDPTPEAVDLASLRARDPAAVARWIRRHEPAIRRLVARVLAWSDDTPDIVQDVFASAIVALPGFRGDSSLETWLMRIAVNRCRRHIRRRQLFGILRRRTAKALSPPADDSMDRAETNRAVRDAVAGLPAKYREVVALRYLEERSARETAEILNERVNTVDVRLHRARAMLETALAHLVRD
ncbi:MAG: sigma-70 family RNA polymerase sigma factor [Phycisphaerales bacterium]|nr:sigma-70 family RNA polymerase sigma factor [Phycisphaerales bacterium]MCB9862699.1 sigma-70 family RNA polymerase sigma factor [Phycisphaerales bacterium]